MPIATPEIYNQMLDSAKSGEYAYPAINCTSSETVNAAMRGFAEADSDGIIQFSTGGADFASGTRVKDMVTGAIALAEFAYVVAAKYPINVALHTDHCPKDKLDTYVRPLLALARERVERPEPAVPVAHVGRLGGARSTENLKIAADLLEQARKPPDRSSRSRSASSAARRTASRHEINEKLYTTPADYEATSTRSASASGPLPAGGDVRQRARRLQAGQRPAAPVRPASGAGDGHRKLGLDAGSKPFDLVFHGGSGSTIEEIHEALELRRRQDEHRHRHAVRVHPADRRPHVQELRRRAEDRRRGRQQEGVRPAPLRKSAEVGMAERVTEACEALRSTGTSLGV